MRVSLPIIGALLVLTGCGTAAGLQSQVTAPQSVPALAAAASSKASGTWYAEDARYGGGDGEGIFWIELYGPEPDYATHSVEVTFTDLDNLDRDIFRYVSLDGKIVPPQSAQFSELKGDLAGAQVPLGVDQRVLKEAVALMERAHR